MEQVLNFGRYLESHASKRPQHPAFVFLENGEHELSRLTFSELDARARSIASLLRRTMSRGDRAILMFPSGPEFICAFMGCLYADVVAVPAYLPRQNRRAARIESILGDSGAQVGLTTTAGHEALERLRRDGAGYQNIQFIRTDDLRDPGPDESHGAFPLDTDPASLAFLQYTSGSTDSPKGVMVSHANLSQNIRMMALRLGYDDSTVFLSWLPLFHDMGLVGYVLTAICLGATAVIMEPAAFIQKPSRWLQGLSTYGVHATGGPNFAFDLCVRKVTDAQKADLDLSGLRRICNGAEPVRAKSVRDFLAAFASCGLRAEAMSPCYGLAEATLWAAGDVTGGENLIAQFAADSLALGRARRPRGGEGTRELVSCGVPAHGSKLLAVNPESRERLSEGIEGEIWIAGRHVAGGYWQRPAESAETFAAYCADGDGPFLRTGDLGFLSGGRLFITGRRKDLIIIRGRNHYPQDIEATLVMSHTALTPNAAAAFSVDENGEERLILVCEVQRSELRRLPTGEIVAAIRRAIAADHELEPHGIVLLKPSGLPRTSSGKIQRSLCRATYLSGMLPVAGEWRAPKVPVPFWWSWRATRQKQKSPRGFWHG